MKFSMKNTRVTIDGREFTGSDIRIEANGTVTVDGVVQEGSLVGPVSVQVHGNVDQLDGSFTNVTVAGNCGSISTMSGDVKCGNVDGDVDTVSGDVECGSVSGRVSTVSGDIKLRG